MIQFDRAIEDLLVEWEERRRSGKEVTAEDLCRGRPERLAELQRRIAALKATDWMFPTDTKDDSALRERSTPLPQQLGEYEILGQIGSGGMGTVYKARHRKLDKLVALKVLSSTRLWDEQAVARFEREMRAVGKLEHVHIVAAYDAGEENGTHFLSMQLIDGLDVGQLVKQQGRLTISDACEIVRQAAMGLQHAHEHGLVHRDVKPSNLMLGHDGLVRLLDLGLARVDEHSASPHESGISSTSHAMGTIDYMSPEQYENSREATAKSDIYSLGATLYVLLCGRPPLAQVGRGEWLKKVRALAAGDIMPVASVRDDLPAKLTELIDCMLAPSAEDRPGLAADVADRLRRFAQGSDLVALANQQPSGISENGDTQRREATMSSAKGSSHSYSEKGSSHSAAAANHSNSPRDAKGDRSWRSARWTLLVFAVVGLLLAAAGVIYVKTDNGTLVVKAGDGVTVEVLEAAGVRLIHKRTGQEYEVRVGEHPHQVGEYSISVKQHPSGLEFSTMEFRIGRGEDEELLVTLKSPSRPSPETKENPKIVVDPPDSVELQFARTVLKDRVHYLCFSPDGLRLFVSGIGDAVVVVDSATGNELQRLTGHRNHSRGMAVSQDGATLYSGDQEGRILEHDLVSGKFKREIASFIGSIRDISLSPDGSRLAVAVQGFGIHVLNLNGDKLRSLHGNYYICPFGKDHETLYSFGIKKNPARFELSENKVTELRENSTPLAGTFCISAKQDICVFAGNDGTVDLFDAQSGDSQKQFKIAGGKQLRICVNPQGTLLAVGMRSKTIQIADMASGKIVSRVTAPKLNLCSDVKFSPDGRRLAFSGIDGTVFLVRLADGLEDTR